MSADAPAPAAPVSRRQRWLRLLLIALVALIGLALLVQLLLPPERALRLVLARLEPTLGLRIGFDGNVEYRLRGTPQLVVRDVRIAAPGEDMPMLQAERMLLSLPWATIRSRGAVLDLTRIELDAPRLHLPALLRWLETRPPGDGRVPTISDGVHVADGRIDGEGWQVHDLALELPTLHARRAVDAQVSGIAHVESAELPFRLRIRADRAIDARALSAAGTLALVHVSGRLDSTLQIDATRIETDLPGFALAPLRIAMDARWLTAGDTDPLPFVMGVHTALRAGAEGDRLRLSPLGLVLRGEGVLPGVTAGGRLAWSDTLELALDGRLERWPDAWPALPAPLSEAPTPLPFALRYAGPADASAPVSLRITHPRARFEGEARIAAVRSWLGTLATGAPLPPLQGRLSADRLEIGGAVLEGVEVEFDDGSGDIAP